MSQTIPYQWERASNLAQGKVVKVGHRRESRESSISQKILGVGLRGEKWLREFQKYSHLIFVFIYRELITDMFRCGQLGKAVSSRKSYIVRFKVPLNANWL